MDELLQANADFTIQNKEDQTPQDIAIFERVSEDICTTLDKSNGIFEIV